MTYNTDRKGTAQKVQVRRFGDTMALSFFASDGATGAAWTETVYVSMAMVDSLALAIRDFRHDFIRNGYPNNKFEARDYSKEGKRLRD